MAPLKYEGCALFRQRITASLLSGNPLKITKIREKDSSIGLQDYEINFLRLIEQITDGCRVEINEVGTSLRFFPGILTGGKVKHDCGTSRGIGWFIEGILPLAVFCKHPLELSLKGLTNESLDISVDTLQSVTIPLLMNFGIMGINMKVHKRGAPPKGGGEVDIYIPIVRTLKPIHIIDEGLVKKVRGIAFCTKISPTIITRVIDSCRGVLNNLLPDVRIDTFHCKGDKGGFSPGYSLSLVAETTTGVLISVERTANTRVSSERGTGELPEDIGAEGAMMLLKEIHLGGVVDSVHQPLMLQLMVLTPEDVSKIRFGELSEQAIATLRLLKDAFGVVFKIKNDQTTTVSVMNSSTSNNNDAESDNEDDEEEGENEDDMSVEDMDDEEEEGSDDNEEGDSEDDEDDEEDDSEDDDDDEGSDGGFEYDDDEASENNNHKSNGKSKEPVAEQKITIVHNTVLLSCFGTGYTNVNRKVT